VGLERNPLSLVSTTEELLERKSGGSSPENQDYGHRGFAMLIMQHPSIHRSWQVDKGQLLGQYSLLVVSGHGVCFCIEP
jgi:hypothetical protein